MIFIVGLSEDPNSLFLIHIQRITHVHWCSTCVNKVESGYVSGTEYAKKLLREFKVMDYKIWHAFFIRKHNLPRKLGSWLNRLPERRLLLKFSFKYFLPASHYFFCSLDFIRSSCKKSEFVWSLHCEWGTVFLIRIKKWLWWTFNSHFIVRCFAFVFFSPHNQYLIFTVNSLNFFSHLLMI